MAEEKKITVDELIKKVEEAKKTKKDYPFEKHIVLKYMPYAEKMALAKGVVNAASYKKVGEVELYERNTSSMLFIFSMKLIEKYTNIELDINNINADFDKLMESGAMDNLTDAIPESEVTILKGMLDMARDDLEFNTRSIVSFLETKSEAIRMAIDSLANVLDNPEIKVKIAELTK